ncbi:Gcv operon activator [Hartmannibacter diazotrophicus]|uniref:Gcv operon activator n=1 Tax=Hartmannibacter diazotrophicus TaxID=1482074 RepID=A0A2C9D084_9HYPH|nr:LysR family transcriptional regulator [Hartmannibacter diazotrophicus]SON53797.1 Gcv operon activator [Hartmannibacter diazotrophicus]
MDWDDLRHFSAFAGSGSLAAAARDLGVEHATVARRIASLEDRLGVKLIDRRGRRLVLTAEGERIAAIAERMATETRAIERLAGGARSDLSGTITISAPSAYATAVLAPKLAGLQRRHPALCIRLLGEARTASLERREADIAIRLSRPDRGDLTILKIGDMPFRLYASQAYVAETPEADWRFIGSDGAMATSPQQAELERIAAGRASSFLSDQAEIQRALVIAGAGVAILPEFMETAGLVRIGQDTPLVTRDIWLVVHSDMRRAAAVRAVIDCLS